VPVLTDAPPAHPAGPSVLSRPSPMPVPVPRRGTPILTSPRVRRNRWIWTLTVVVLALLGVLVAGRGHGRSAPPSRPPAKHHPSAPPTATDPRLDPDWDGDGKPVTLAFGGDVHFPAGTNLGDRLAADPSTALGPGAAQLLSGVDISMTNLESALTDGTCPDPEPKQYVFYAPASAVQAFRGAGVTLITEANNHGEDCGASGLQTALAVRAQSGYPILGIGQNVDQAFTPYRATVNGEKIVIIAATQVIDTDLQTAWTATTDQPGLASAYDVEALVAAVEAARRVADTVVVYLHWGTELDDCPNPLQEPLAQVLVAAGADIVVGTHAHVLLGGGYLGSAYVDYGLGNFAFYDNSPPENESGSLVVTVTGRHIDDVVWRPALIVDDLPEPLTGAAATTALGQWNAARACTNVTVTPSSSIATASTETSPAPPSAVARLSVDSS
jgi:hypothetical protein